MGDRSWLRRCLAAFVLCALVALLSACGGQGAPATTEALLMRYVAHEDAENFHVDGDIRIGVEGMGIRVAIPITASFDYVGGYAHGRIVADLSTVGVDDYVLEAYMAVSDDAIDCYLRQGGDDARPWERWSCDMNERPDIVTLTKLLSASELSVIAKESDELVRFELGVPTETVLRTAFDLMDDPPDIDMNDFEDDRVIFDFTQDCYLRAASTDARFECEIGTSSLVATINVDASVKFSAYGEQSQADLTVPDEVAEAAKPTDKPIDVAAILGTRSSLGKTLNQPSQDRADGA